jgi:hypothetical protein
MKELKEIVYAYICDEYVLIIIIIIIIISLSSSQKRVTAFHDRSESRFVDRYLFSFQNFIFTARIYILLKYLTKLLNICILITD